MAVLKDLIVHGPSNFIGTTQFTNLKANKIKAVEGIFNKLIATTADFDTMTANNATVVGLLDVKGELHTNSWTNSNIATIEGSFYITPTVSCASGTFNYDGTNITLTAASGNSFAISSLYINSGDAGGTTAAWTAYSEVLITGQVAVGNEKVPLGTIKGKITSTAPTTSKIIINSLTDGKGGTSNVLASIGTGSKTFYDIKISMLKRGNGSAAASALPVGIFMTAMGQNGATFLDIYGGHNAASTTVGGGLAKPVLRIGNLSGMPAIGGVTPAGYGIYTSNGYFTGTIVSTSGKIGNWSITGSSIQTGAFNTASTMYFGTSGISLGTTFRVTAAGALTATNGTIGGWSIGADSISKASSVTSGTASTQYQTLLYAPTVSNATYAMYVRHRSYDGSAYGSWTDNFLIRYDGYVYARNIETVGGKIGGFAIDSTSIHTNGVAVTSNADNSIALSSTDFTRTINGTSRAGLRFAVGDKFALTGDGAIFASGATISGALTATSGTIGGCTISNGTLQIAAANITSGTLADARIPNLAISKITNLSTEISSAKGTANSFIYYSSSTGLKLAQSNPSSATSNYVQITSTEVSIIKDSTHKAVVNNSGLSIYNGNASTPVASFGTSAIVGQVATNKYNTLTDDNGIHLRSNTTIIGEFTKDWTWIGVNNTSAGIRFGGTWNGSSGSYASTLRYSETTTSGVKEGTTYLSQWLSTSAFTTSTIQIDNYFYSSCYVKLMASKNSFLVNSIRTNEVLEGQGEVINFKSDYILFNEAQIMIGNGGVFGNSANPCRYWGAGYLTNSSKEIHITLPLRRVLGLSSGSFNIGSVTAITRQNNKYTHGSASSTRVAWTVSNAAISPFGINLTLTRTTTTNATNNAPIGVDLEIEFIQFYKSTTSGSFTF